MKKAGIPFPVYIDTVPDRVIADGQITASYRKADSGENTFTPIATPASATGQDGTYEIMVTIPSKGFYQLAIDVAADESYEAEKITTSVQVLDATIDDVASKIDAAVVKIDDMKSQIDVLDEATVNEIKAAVDGLETKLTTLTTLINDENDPAITSLRELLNDLASSVDSNQSLLTAIQTFVNESTDDIEKMIRGDELLTNGTPNPFFGKTNIDIMNTLQSMNTFINDKLNTVQNAIENKVEDARAELVAAIADVTTIATSNQTLLNHDVNGLAAIKTKLESTSVDLNDGINSLTQDIQSVATQLTTINSQLHSKIDAVKSDTEELLRRSSKKTNTKVAV